MKRLEFLAATVVFWSMCVTLQAQDVAPTLGEQRAAMGKLQSLVGEWKGTGWIEFGPRRFNFESSEVFTQGAGGLAITVAGLHHVPTPDGQKQVVHDAVAMITFDPESDRYRFVTQLASGRAGDYQARVTEDGDFQWAIPDTPGGKMIYTISIRDNDEYHEAGELIAKSGDRKQFFEMTLKRVKDSKN